jgi:glycosyltransferase involved in cell wall biosynthesis
VLFLSRLTPKKGLDILLRVWHQLRPQGWRLVVAGPDEGGYGAALARAGGTPELGRGIEFVGPAWGEEKWRLYRDADVFVLPSHSENFGVVVAEALASGVPAITTRETPWQAIEEKRCGWWIEVGDAPLAGALREAMALPDHARREMGTRGRRFVEEEYAPAGVAARMIELYGWLLRGGSRPQFVNVDET